jgi:hypothetical protein
MSLPASEPRFRPRDLLILLAIFALGGAGYLCDVHSPVILPFLWLFGLAFSSALLVLAGLIFRDSVVFRTHGWLAGLLFVSLPFIAWLFFYVGTKLISVWQLATLK